MNSNFVDYVKIHVKSGKGGAGSAHLHREKYVPKGGPDGGDRARHGASMRRHDLALWRAVLPQHASLSFPLTVEDVVALGRAPRALRSQDLPLLETAQRGRRLKACSPAKRRSSCKSMAIDKAEVVQNRRAQHVAVL